MLAIGGVGGLAIGLAGREILENLFTGLIILSSSPFEVGEEVLFTPPSGPVSLQALPAMKLTDPLSASTAARVSVANIEPWHCCDRRSQPADVSLQYMRCSTAHGVFATALALCCTLEHTCTTCMQAVEGIVLDVGWYRTTIRSFEREIYNIPNSVFSRNVVLNITRKQREWRFFEFIGA